MASSIILSEKRRLQRRELIYYLKVSELLTSSELGRLIDVHANGLLLIGSQGLTLNKEYLIGIELPRALADRGLPQVGAKAKCVWIKPSQTKPFTESGLMFLETSEEARRTIGMMIDLFAISDPNPKA
ncbi:MAG: PilZ domain-containing protein [Deltaproteobacteria bacterium]|jgi:hypothetical protein|nr:PilZ domain-containing protein [Deltaproteobacteria bacterium]